MSRARVPHAAGLGLVELLVSMALVATLTAMGLGAYARAHATWRAQAADQRRLERAQYVFRTLEPDLQMAGYFGRARPLAPLPDAAIPAAARACGMQVISRIDRAVEVPASLPAGCMPARSRVEGSDVLVIRRASAQLTAPRAGRAQWLAGDETPPVGALLWDGLLPPGRADRELRDLVVRLCYVARSADGDADTPALRVKSLTEVAGAPAFIDTEVMPGVESLEVEMLPEASPRSVRLTLRVREDAGDAGARDAAPALSVTRHFSLRNAGSDAP